MSQILNKVFGMGRTGVRIVAFYMTIHFQRTIVPHVMKVVWSLNPTHSIMVDHIDSHYRGVILVSYLLGSISIFIMYVRRCVNTQDPQKISGPKESCMVLAIQQDTSMIGVDLVTKRKVADKDNVKIGKETDPTRDDGELHGSHQTRGASAEDSSGGSNTSQASSQNTSTIQIESMGDPVILGRSKPQPRATMTMVMDRG